ncbi:hypothetical protein CIPAW_03G065500 [Carya illinoinensis]|uniref:Uncharacterized protein n=1 Tax=Carya illinoinensis TaxID=32201 RepID=A0A8T1QXM0_CARIL|nr:hypothetical protein CIPAW_03G065500 [Carya illinoinensis]
MTILSIHFPFLPWGIGKLRSYLELEMEKESWVKRTCSKKETKKKREREREFYLTPATQQGMQKPRKVLKSKRETQKGKGGTAGNHRNARLWEEFNTINPKIYLHFHSSQTAHSYNFQ